MNTLDSDYDGFEDALTHMLGVLTFDDVRNKLLVHELCVQLLKHRNNGSLTHPAFVSTTITSHGAGTTPQSLNSNSGHGKNN